MLLQIPGHICIYIRASHLAFLSKLRRALVRAFIGLKTEVEGTSTFKLLSILSLWDMQVFTSLGDCGFVIDDIRYLLCDLNQGKGGKCSSSE